MKTQAFVIAFPFSFLLIDIGCWWLIKWYPFFAYVEILAGTLMNLTAGYMILTSLYQMWFMPIKKLRYNKKQLQVAFLDR